MPGGSSSDDLCKMSSRICCGLFYQKSSSFSRILAAMHTLVLVARLGYVNKNSKRIWKIIRRKQAIDSIQNSSGKPNHQATDNWEIKLLDKGQLLNRLQCSGLRQLPKQV